MSSHGSWPVREPTGAELIRVSLIGAGVMGSLHGRNFGTFGDRAGVTHVFDTDSRRAAELAAELGAIQVDDLETAVSAPGIDAVAICIPPFLHRPVVELALSHRKHVFLEKPIATTRADADAIIGAAERSGRLLMVGHVLRFWPGYPELYKQIAGGSLGPPNAITCYRLQSPPAASGWLTDIEATGGIAPLILVHDFDQMNWILGTPRSVLSAALIGEGVSASHVIIAIEYDEGKGAVEGSISMPRSYAFSTRMRVFCEQGFAECGYDIEPSNGSESGDVERDVSLFTPRENPALRIYRNHPKPPELIELPKNDPWRPELAHFVSCLEEHREIEHGTPYQARDALDVALAANESLETGKRVSV